MRFGILSLVPALAACSASSDDGQELSRTEQVPQEQSLAQGSKAARTTEEPLPGTGGPASAAQLAGEYRIAGAGGQPIDLPHAITASFSEERIDVVSDCVRMRWSYRYEGGALATEPVPVISCQRGLYPEEAAVSAAFDAGGTVRRTEQNGIEIASGNSRVILFSQ